MPVIPFSEYRPDVSDYQAATEKGILNVVPRGDGFGPFPSLAALSASLGAQCRGAFEAVKTDGSVVVFAATATDLFLLNNTDYTWSKVSKGLLPTPVNAAFSTATTGGSLAAGTYWYRVSATNASGETLASTETSQSVPAGTATNTVTVNWGAVAGATGYKVYGRTSGTELLIAAVGAVTTYADTGALTPAGALPSENTTASYAAVAGPDQWQFCQFNNLVIAVQANVVPQVFTLGTSTAFANLAGGPPPARYIGIVGRFVVLTGLLSNPNRVQWSGLNDVNGPNSWTPGINSSDQQDLADGGVCRGVAGGESGVILQDSVIRRMIYLPGDPRVFQIEKIAEGLGIYGPYSLVRSGSSVFFYSIKGFYRIDPGSVPVPIGRERVDRTFFTDLDATQPQLFQGAADPRSTRIIWVYKSVNGATNQFDKVLCYDTVLDKFTPLRLSGEFLFSMSQPGVTLEGIDAILGTNLDAITISLDSFSTAIVNEMAAFDVNHKLNFFRGPSLEATLETAEQGTDGARVKLKRGFRPVSDALIVYGSASRRENLQAVVVAGGESKVNATTGICNMLVDTRYSRFKCRIPAGSVWTFINGVEPLDFKPTGKR